MIDRHLLRNIDWTLITLLLLNSVLGVIIVYSSSYYLTGNYYLRQIIWIILSLIALFLLLIVDYKNILTYSFYIYIIFIFFLAGMFFFGKITAGAKSWVKLPFFQVQPSELNKIIVILFLAKVLSEFKKKYFSRNVVFSSVVIVAVPIF